MRDSQARSQSTPNARRLNQKRLGGYLIEAGLLTPAQVDVALNDQTATGMRFGEVLVARGWIKRQTIEYLMKKVIVPEQQALLKAEQALPRRTQSGQLLPPSSVPSPSDRTPTDRGVEGGDRSSPLRRDLPISKPLPSTGNTEGGVSWVG